MATKKKIDTTQLDPMTEFVVKEFERYEKAHKDRFQMAQECVDQWNNVPIRKDWEWMNAVHVPITFASEQTITPRVFAAIFPNDAPIDVVVFGEATEEQGIAIKTALQHGFKQANVQGESLVALTQNTLLGTGYVEAPYLYRKGWTIDNQGNRNFSVIERRPDCKSVNYFEMFPHPAKMRMNDGLPLIRRRYVDAEYLKALASNPEGKFENLTKALETECPNPQRHMPAQSQIDKRKREEYEILEYWGPWDDSYVKDNAVVPRLAVPYWIQIINRKVCVRGIPNPYNFQHAPYCKFNFYPPDKPSWYGVGIGQAGKPTQDRLNKIVNQRLDNVDLILNKQGAYNGNDPLINVKKLQVSKPGLWHKVSDTVTSLKWIDTPDVTSSSYKEEELAKSDYRDVTGASAPLMPTENPHETASGINLLQGAAGVRFRPILQKIENDLIADLAQIFLSHYQQFMVIPEWMKLVTDNGQSQPILIKPQDIQGKATIICTGVSESLNKETQIGQLLRFKEVSQNDQTVNQAEINKKIAELMGFKDIHKFIVNQQPVQAGPGLPSPEEQMLIQKRLAEGATPQQIHMELLGQQPGPTSGQPDPNAFIAAGANPMPGGAAPQGATPMPQQGAVPPPMGRRAPPPGMRPGNGMPVHLPMTHMGPGPRQVAHK